MLIKLLEILSTILFFVLLPFLYVERVFHKKSFGWYEKFGNINFPFENEKVLMLHACSVGEVIAIENLIKEIRLKFPNYKLILTTSTKTGQDIAHKKLSDYTDFITYFPFDVPFAVNKFLDKVKPFAVFHVETEIWPYFAYACKKREIPISIINGRISDSTFKFYKLAKTFFKKVFKKFHYIYVQSQEDFLKFAAIGMDKKRIEFMGNLKFNVKRQDVDINIGQQGYKVIIAGSTHKGENEIVLNTYNKLKDEINNVKLLIAPRHLERVSDIEGIAKNLSLNIGKRSLNDNFSQKDVIILDTLGELGKMYSICDIAFIGGSFNNTGGHNPLEASIYYKPTLSGPTIHNFKDIYSILKNANAGIVMNKPSDLYNVLKDLLQNDAKRIEMGENCQKVFETQKGAIDFVLNKISELG